MNDIREDINSGIDDMRRKNQIINIKNTKKQFKEEEKAQYKPYIDVMFNKEED